MQQNIHFTYFDSINSTAKYDLDINNYIELIKLGFVKNKVNPARKEYAENGKTKQYDNLKKSLPVLTISCTIKKGLGHKEENIKDRNKLICIDIDNDADNKGKLNAEMIERIKADNQTLIVHNSVSGIGICVFVLINSNDFLSAFYSLENYYKTKYDLVIDEKCKNINRLRFLSADSNIYYNSNAIQHFTDVPKNYKPIERVKTITTSKKVIDVSKWIIVTQEKPLKNETFKSGHKYQLEPYSMIGKKYICPKCNKSKFTKYVNIETGQYIADNVGKCDDITESCAYHYAPKQFFKDNVDFEETNETNEQKRKDLEMHSDRNFAYFNISIVKDMQSNQSNFVQFLYSNFDKNKVDEAIELYQIGNSNAFNGNSVIFWDITPKGKVLSGSIMQYDKNTGKRIKTPTNQIKSVQSALGINSKYYFKQGLFGEHLTAVFPEKHINIVESQKTAVIGSIVMPQYNWIACNGIDKLSILKLSNIIHYRKDNKLKLVPDLDAVDKWIEKGNVLDIPVLKNFTTFATDDDIKNGLDIADLILRLK